MRDIGSFHCPEPRFISRGAGVLNFNEFSNHAPAYFSLKTNYVPRVNCTDENAFHK